MKKSILILTVLFSLFTLNIQAAQTDWGDNLVVTKARSWSSDMNGFFSILNQKISSVGDQINLTAREVLGTNDDTVFAKVKISLFNQSVNSVFYKYKVEIWTPNSDSAHKVEIYSNEGFSSGVLFERSTDGSQIGLTYLEWDNTETRNHFRQTYFFGTNYRYIIDIYEYSDKVVSYSLKYYTASSTVVNLLGAVISKTFPYNTVVRQGSCAYNGTYAFEKDSSGNSTAGLIGKFNDSSSYSNGWINDGFNSSYNFTADGYPDPTQLDVNIFSTYNTYAYLSGFTPSNNNQTLTFGNSYVYNFTINSPGF